MKKIIAGNWKMDPVTEREATAIFKNIKAKAGKLKNVQTIVCAPHVFLGPLGKLVTGHRCATGAQNMHAEKGGAHTGEVSVSQVKAAKAEYVILGHSERRAAGETSDVIAGKVKAALAAGLIPILCVGEVERDDEGKYTNEIKEQLLASLKGVAKNKAKGVVIAYEPVWAIGKSAKREATPEDVLEVAIFIRKVLHDAYGKKAGEGIPVLYGGSTNPRNAKALLERGQVDGLLVGRASLKPAQFTQMLEIANNLS